MHANKFSGEAGPGAKKFGIDCLDPGAGYGAETCPVEVSDNIPFSPKSRCCLLLQMVLVGLPWSGGYCGDRV